MNDTPVCFHEGLDEGAARAVFERLERAGLQPRLEREGTTGAFQVWIAAGAVSRAVRTVSHPELAAVAAPEAPAAPLGPTTPAAAAAGEQPTSSPAAGPVRAGASPSPGAAQEPLPTVLVSAKPAERGTGSDLAAVVVFLFLGVVLLGLVAAMIVKAQTLQYDRLPPKTHPFEAHNFRLELGGAWARVENAEVPANAVAAFRRSSPQAWLAVQARPVGRDATAASQLEAWRSVLADSSDALEMKAPRKATLGGVEGQLALAYATVGERRLVYECWSGVSRGFGFLLVSWGERSAESDVRAAAQKARGGFALHDPKREAPGLRASPSKVRPYVSADFGLRIELPPDRWGEWPDVNEYADAASWGAQCGASGAMAVLPFVLPELDLPAEAVHDALVQQFGLRAGSAGYEPTPIAVGGARGFLDRAQWRSKSGQTFLYRIKTLSWRGAAVMAIEWHEEGDAVSARRCRGAIEQLRLESPKPPPRRAERPELDAEMAHDLGVALAAQGRTEQALACHRRAVELASAKAAYFGALVDTLAKSGKAPEALALVDRELKRRSGADAAGLKARRATILDRLGKAEEAGRSWEAAFAEGLVSDRALDDYTNFLERQGRVAAALALLERYRREHDSLSAVLQHAAVLTRSGDRPGAVKLLKDRQAAVGFDPEIALDLGHYLSEEGQHAEALELAEQVLARGVDWAAIHSLKGECEAGLKWYPRAKASFEEALKRDPSDGYSRRMLAYVSGKIGEGENSAIKQVIDPVPLPQELKALPKQAPPSDGKGASVLRWVVAFDYAKGKPVRRTEYRTIQVDDLAGVGRFSTFRFSLDPHSEAIHVNRLVVTDESGKEVSTGSPSDYYLSDQASSELGTQRRQLFIPVPGLKPGRRIDLVVTRRDLAPAKEFDFFGYAFGLSVPVAREAVVLRGDLADTVDARTTGAVEAVRLSQGGRAWWVDLPPVAASEPFEPPYEEMSPTLALGSASGSWKALAKEYLGSIQAHLAPVPEIEALARKQASGAAGREAIPRLARFVQKELTYKAIEFGRAARIPRKVEQTVHNRYGDCKDHSLLLLHLLRAVGVEARLAVVSTGDPVVPTLPSLDQFDHMVVYVPGEPALFLDATSDFTDVGQGTPYWLAGRDALVLDEGDARLVRILPDLRAITNAIDVQRRLSVGADGAVTVQEKATLSGLQAEMAREGWGDADPEHRKKLVQGLLAEWCPEARLTSLAFAALEEPDKPLEVELAYRLERRFQVVDGALVGRLPAIWEREKFNVAYLERRTNPFKIVYPLKLRAATAVEPADGYEGTFARPGSGETKRQGPVQWRAAQSGTPRRLVLEVELQRHAQATRPASEYEGFRKAAEAALAEVEAEVVLRPTRRVAPAQP